MKNYKRQFRELDDDVKKKISTATKGKKKSFTHKQHIAQAMVDYWKKVPHKPNSGETLNS